MANLDSKKSPVLDWHPADVVASVRKAGQSLRRLSISNGYHAQSLQLALRKPWPRAERIIAAAIGVAPQSIWPTRYRVDGAPKSGRNERGIGRAKGKHSTGTTRGNVYPRGRA